jgi:hypothetical protein
MKRAYENDQLIIFLMLHSQLSSRRKISIFVL